MAVAPSVAAHAGTVARHRQPGRHLRCQHLRPVRDAHAARQHPLVRGAARRDGHWSRSRRCRRGPDRTPPRPVVGVAVDLFHVRRRHDRHRPLAKLLGGRTVQPHRCVRRNGVEHRHGLPAPTDHPTRALRTDQQRLPLDRHRIDGHRRTGRRPVGVRVRSPHAVRRRRHRHSRRVRLRRPPAQQ